MPKARDQFDGPCNSYCSCLPCIEAIWLEDHQQVVRDSELSVMRWLTAGLDASFRRQRVGDQATSD